MRSFLLSPLLLSLVSAQYVLESLSFGQGKGISPNRYAIPGWHISGEGHTPQLLSDKVILTPPYPGNTRGAMWTETRSSQSEWTVDFEFRAGGPEHGGGNLQLWYTRDGQVEVGTSSVYTVGKFDGLALIIDMHGGRGGGVRGFLNDGSTDYKSHHHVEALAFGHCDYAYRNLGRPSRIQLKQDSTGLEVSVDEQRCFRSDKIKLPSDNYFGVTAASSETPDSFEVFKFIVKTTTSYAREEPRKQQVIPPIAKVEEVTPDSASEKVKDSEASSIKSQDAQFADLHNRLQLMSHSMDNLFRELTRSSSLAQARQSEMQSTLLTKDHVKALEDRLQKIESSVTQLRKDVNSKDYTGHFNDIHTSLKTGHDNLLASLPDTVGHVISSRSPRTGFLVGLVVVSQVVLAGAYVLYKRRRANAPKKYL